METVSIQVIAACSGLSHDTLQRRIRRGEMPSPDSRTHEGLGWYLSTIKDWNPALAARIERGVQHKVFPLLAADRLTQARAA